MVAAIKVKTHMAKKLNILVRVGDDFIEQECEVHILML